MNKQELEMFSAMLQTLKADLDARADASKLATKTVELDQAAVGRVSRIDALQQQQMALEAERRRQVQLKQIEGAFIRLTNEEYGECYVCGEAIGLKRLHLNPLLTRCITCAE